MMRKLCALMITVIVLITVRPAHANQLDDIRAAGVLRAAVFDSNPPFGSKATVSHELVCYDVDFAAAIAKHIGVKLKLLATNPSNRIPLLQAGKADLIVAYLTITHRRAEVIEFSIPYFRTGVQLMVRTEDSNRFEVRVAAKTDLTAEDGLTGCNINDAQAQAAYQGTDLLDFADQHSIRMHQPGEVKFAAVTLVERLHGLGLGNVGTDRCRIEDGVEPLCRQLIRQVSRRRHQSFLMIRQTRRHLAGSIHHLERKNEQRRHVGTPAGSCRGKDGHDRQNRSAPGPRSSGITLRVYRTGEHSL